MCVCVCLRVYICQLLCRIEEMKAQTEPLGFSKLSQCPSHACVSVCVCASEPEHICSHK